jgi:hypothetical protein
MTCGLAMTCLAKSHSQTAFHDSGHHTGLPSMDRDILDDEDNEEEPAGRNCVGQPQAFTPPAPGMLGLRDSDSSRADVGQPVRSPLLRC